MTRAAPLVGFRVDGSARIGAGHVRRCLTLADALRAQGAETVFLCATDAESFNNLVVAARHRLIELPAGVASDNEADAQACLAALGDEPLAALVVDHYALGQVWERAMRPVALRLVVLDDLADRAHDCDLLIDTAPGDPQRYAGLVPPACALQLGPRFALLRDAFRAQPPRVRDGAIARVLISFGAIDADNLSREALAAVRAALPRETRVDLVLSHWSPHRAAMAAAAADDPWLELHLDTPDMAALMARADLAIGAGGTTSWERAALGLPALVVEIADNQRATLAGLADAGCALRVEAGAGLAERLRDRLALLAAHRGLVIGMAHAGQALVDGRGAARVARAILPLALSLRQARSDDAALLLAGRNRPAVRQASLDQDEIDPNAHAAWFAARLADRQSQLLIGEVDGRAVGVLRYDFEADRARVSLYLLEDGDARGFGSALLAAGEAWLGAHRPDCGGLVAEVRNENIASRALFAAAGYACEHAVWVKELRQ